MPFTGWSVEDLTNRLTTEQVNYVLDSVKSELELARRREVKMGEILHSLATDPFQFPDRADYTDDDRSIVQERRAVLAVWDKVLFLVASEGYHPPAISDIRLQLKIDEDELARIKLVVVEPLPPENLEVLKELVKKAALRKLKEMESPGVAEKEKTAAGQEKEEQ